MKERLHKISFIFERYFHNSKLINDHFLIRIAGPVADNFIPIGGAHNGEKFFIHYHSRIKMSPIKVSA